MLWTTLAIFGVQFLTGIPTFSLLTPYLIFIYGFIYMFSVYGYTYKCLPTVNCLLEDLTPSYTQIVPNVFLLLRRYFKIATQTRVSCVLEPLNSQNVDG